jgi:hypothetical protein
MLVQDIEIQLLGPPFPVRRATTRMVMDRTLAFFIHGFPPVSGYAADPFRQKTELVQGAGSLPDESQAVRWGEVVSISGIG